VSASAADRTARGRAFAGAIVVVVSLSLVGTSPAGHQGLRTQQADPRSGRVTIRIAADARGRGTFAVEGALSDAGSARMTRARAGSRLTLTHALEGDRGTVVLRAVQRCGAGQATWTILRASGGYAGIAGGGRGTAAPCAGPARPLRAVYRGAVRAPVPPTLARPGLYAGWTGQRERISLEVLPGGRLVSSVRVERLSATCAPPPDVVLEPAFPSTYPISADGAFSVAFGSVALSGRFDQAGAAGTIAYASQTGATMCTSGAVSWSATSPPDPLPTAPSGAYCGSTSQGLGVCLTLTPAGRVTRVRLEATLECTHPEQALFGTVAGFGGSVPVRSNLRFDVQGSLEDNASGDYVLAGTFDPGGTVSGTLSVHRVRVDQEGTLFTCRNSAHTWTARRLG